MKVLFNTMQPAFQKSYFGGAEIQLLKTKEYLEKLKVKVKGFNQFEDQLTDFDILHNFSMQRDTLKLFSLAKKLGLKLALSTIYWPPKELIFSDNPIAGIGKVMFEEFSKIRSNANPFYSLYPFKEFLELADILLPNSETEKNMIAEKFKIPKRKFHVVPNGVDKRYAKATPDLFVKKYKMKDFALFVGRIDPRKNLLKAIQAAKELEIEFVIIGAASPDKKDYMERCKEEAKGAKVHFLGGFEPGSELLMSAYAAAKTLVLPSAFETPGLVALEAALTGCNISITDRGSTTDYFKNMADYCNPRNFNSIKESIKIAHSRERNEKLKKHILDNYTWEKVAERTLQAYKKIL